MRENTARLGRASLCAALLSVAAGCATVTRGEHESWSVITTPPGASVKTSTGAYCDATPCTMKLKRKVNFVATITKPGFKTVQANIGHKIATNGGAAFLGNAVFGGPLGAGLDAFSGATLDLKPNPLNVVLVADDASAPVPAADAAPPVAAATLPPPPAIQPAPAAPTDPAPSATQPAPTAPADAAPAPPPADPAPKP